MYQLLISLKCFDKLFHGCVAGTVTVATLGSPNTTPCDIAAAGTTNVAVKSKSLFPTASGNSGIVTIAVLTPSGNKTSRISGLKYVSPIEIELSS